ncbi:MAG: response regulator [Planctomycetes bacterium]|nr:response regulator [Planctomycetota bacterium]
MKKKVLIADDEVSIRRLYERELKKEGYEVLTAENGQEAIQQVQNQKPDLVILDIRMPGMDGIQTLSRILEENNELPVIISTAYSSYKENFMSWAADAYVVKSSDLSELKSTVRAVFEQRNVLL